MYDYTIYQNWFGVWSDPFVNYSALKSDIASSPSWGDIPAVSSPGYTGWSAIDGFGYLWTYSTSLSKNTTGIIQPYFIAKLTSGNIIRSPGYIESGVYTFRYELSLVETGMVGINEVIGPGYAINVDYPSDSPSPPEMLGNNAVSAIKIYAVIGIDPPDWASAMGLSFGSHYITTA
jgi:hypothetical protein